MRILLIILSFLVFRNSISACSKVSSMVALENRELGSTKCCIKSILSFGSCCEKSHGEPDNSDSERDSSHKCNCLSSLAVAIGEFSQNIELSCQSLTIANHQGFGDQHMFSTDILEKVSNPPKNLNSRSRN
jgi:hypothetical protein